LAASLFENMPEARCRLLALCGHFDPTDQCPLSGEYERTTGVWGCGWTNFISIALEVAPSGRMLENPVVGANHRRKSAECAAQALDTERTERQRLQSHLQAEAWLQLAIHDEENDAVRLLQLALRNVSK
jgi:hypothetical protein